MPSSSSKELKIFAMFCNNNDQVRDEIKALVWQQYDAVKKYKLNLWQTAYDQEQLAFKYESLLEKHRKIKIAGSATAVTGCVMAITGGVTSIVLTGGAAAPLLAGGLMVTGTATEIGGGVAKFGNNRTTQKREAELAQELARILTTNAECHDMLKGILETINQDQIPRLRNGSVGLELMESLKKMATDFNAKFPSLKEDLLKNPFNTIKHIGSKTPGLAKTIPGVPPFTSNLLKGGSKAKVAGKSLGKVANSKVPIVLGDTAIALGAFTLRFEIFEIIQDSKKPKSTIVQDLRLMATRLKMEVEY